MTHRLVKDIVSITRSQKLYGKAGAPVVIIADHMNVVIVEGLNNERFSVNKEFLTTKIETDVPTNPAANDKQQVVGVDTQEAKQLRPKKKIKSAPGTKNPGKPTLF